MKTPDIFTRSVQQAARIAELEAQLHDYIEKHAAELAKNDRLQKQLAAAQERERAATANKKQLARLALWFGVCISDDDGTLRCRSCGARLDEDDDNFTTGHYTPCKLNDAAATALAAAQQEGRNE